MKINTNVWKIVLRFDFRGVSSGHISDANRGISVNENVIKKTRYNLEK